MNPLLTARWQEGRVPALATGIGPAITIAVSRVSRLDAAAAEGQSDSVAGTRCEALSAHS
jgi:hypothetical protein